MKKLFALLFLVGCIHLVQAQNKHSPSSNFPTYEGRVMCGYQGWFRAEGDGSGEGWTHYSEHGQLTAATLHPDFWPDVSEYEKTYPTVLKNQDGTPARVFSSVDQSTTDLHFKWMQEYGIDGVFVQRFFGGLRTPEARKKSRVVLEHAIIASQKSGRAIAVMYDLSGLRDHGEDCSAIIQDWKELVDDLKITSQPTNNYLYHRGKPLVAIWGLGFPDRGYNIRDIGIDKVIDFLKHDPQYGGCSVMLGVPTYFRELKIDTNPDPYLHQLIESADVVMPWMVQRFTPLVHLFDTSRYEEQVKGDLVWCAEHHVDYVPCVYPGFSWYNMHDHGRGDNNLLYPLNQIPRQKGRCYWNLISAAIDAKAGMLYVAMFDEMDEGTAIFKCSNHPPAGVKLCDYEGLPTDHYLWLTGEAGKMLRGEIPFTGQMPARSPQINAAAASAMSADSK
ncbi:MAG TPA: glycoside hydrolase family 71/99-like protein [Candidatus Sulfotelmatobacter sp.]|nr:glycoside hydrolase family 71/99-like protein [Candidatus Sulfotelmatobacter sp.]